MPQSDWESSTSSCRPGDQPQQLEGIQRPAHFPYDGTGVIDPLTFSVAAGAAVAFHVGNSCFQIQRVASSTRSRRSLLSEHPRGDGGIHHVAQSAQNESGRLVIGSVFLPPVIAATLLCGPLTRLMSCKPVGDEAARRSMGF